MLREFAFYKFNGPFLSVIEPPGLLVFLCFEFIISYSLYSPYPWFLAVKSSLPGKKNS